jgi:hypothetical protein
MMTVYKKCSRCRIYRKKLCILSCFSKSEIAEQHQALKYDEVEKITIPRWKLINHEGIFAEVSPTKQRKNTKMQN